MINIIVVPWTSYLIALLFYILIYTRRKIKYKYYKADFHMQDQDDFSSGNLGFIIVYIAYITFIGWYYENQLYPGSLIYSGSLIYNIVLILAGIYLLLPYLMVITPQRIVHTSIILIFFILTPFINWVDFWKMPAAFVPLIILIILVMISKIINSILFLIDKNGEGMTRKIKIYKPELVDRIINPKFFKFGLFLMLILTMLAINAY